MGSRVASPRDGIRVWLLVCTMALVHCLAFTDRMITSLLAPAIKAALTLSDFQVGLLQGTAFVVVFGLASLAAGWLADRRHRLALIVVSLLVSSVATACIGLATSFGDMFVARMLLGCGQAILSPAALSLLAQILPRDRMGRGISIYTAGSTLGRSLALVGGGAILAALPAVLVSAWGPVPAWRAVCLLAIIPNLVTAVLLLLFFEEPKRALRQRGLQAGQALVPWLLRHRRFYLTHSTLAAAIVLVIQTVTAWTTTLLARRHGLSLPVSGSVFGLIVLVAAPLGHMSGGALIDRLMPSFGRRTPGIVMAVGLLAAVPLTAAFGFAANLGVALAALMALSFTMGVTAPSGFVGIQISTPRHLRGRATAAFLICVTTIGFGLGPPALGLLTDRVFGVDGIGTALFAVVACAAAMGTAAILVQWAQTPRRESLGGAIVTMKTRHQQSCLD